MTASAARNTSTRWRIRTRTELDEWVPQAGRQAEEACRSSPTSPATSRTPACAPALDPRPRHRLAPRPHHLDDRQHALRRLRPAAGLDHVHAAQPVPRHPRGRSGATRKPAASTNHLHHASGQHRRGHRFHRLGRRRRPELRGRRSARRPPPRPPPPPAPQPSGRARTAPAPLSAFAHWKPRPAR